MMIKKEQSFFLISLVVYVSMLAQTSSDQYKYKK